MDDRRQQLGLPITAQQESGGEGNAMLTIYDIKKADEGTYMCTAANPAGTVERELVVYGKFLLVDLKRETHSQCLI